MSETILQRCHQYFSAEVGFECYPFKVEWYNETVGPPFHLAYDADVLAVLVINTPKMFTRLFWPWLRNRGLGSLDEIRDPIDSCMTQFIQQFVQSLNSKCIAVQDFEMTPTRRAKVLMNVVGHISGATCYYQRSDLAYDPWDQSKRIAGLTLHPNYGGWFAYRAVLIFPDILVPCLARPQAARLLDTDEKVIDALQKYNFSWKTAAYRDVQPVTERYDDRQREYFSTEPSKRRALLKQWVDEDLRNNVAPHIGDHQNNKCVSREWNCKNFISSKFPSQNKRMLFNNPRSRHLLLDKIHKSAVNVLAGTSVLLGIFLSYQLYDFWTRVKPRVQAELSLAEEQFLKEAAGKAPEDSFD
uniref:Cyanocobalamin reductase (cyanide-eliminating) n=1 Tax=Trichuris muris TaxID=70415 RepID=A0A5S6QJH1_TRIMR